MVRKQKGPYIWSFLAICPLESGSIYSTFSTHTFASGCWSAMPFADQDPHFYGWPVRFVDQSQFHQLILLGKVHGFCPVSCLDPEGLTGRNASRLRRWSEAATHLGLFWWNLGCSNWARGWILNEISLESMIQSIKLFKLMIIGVERPHFWESLFHQCHGMCSSEWLRPRNTSGIGAVRLWHQGIDCIFIYFRVLSMWSICQIYKCLYGIGNYVPFMLSHIW